MSSYLEKVIGEFSHQEREVLAGIAVATSKRNIKERVGKDTFALSAMILSAAAHNDELLKRFEEIVDTK